MSHSLGNAGIARSEAERLVNLQDGSAAAGAKIENLPVTGGA